MFCKGNARFNYRLFNTELFFLGKTQFSLVSYPCLFVNGTCSFSGNKFIVVINGVRMRQIGVLIIIIISGDQFVRKFPELTEESISLCSPKLCEA